MKLPPPFPKRATLAALAASVVALALLAGCKKKPAPATPPPAKPAATNSAAGAGTNLVTEFFSVFDNSPPPGNKGRDPFNPDSKSRYPVPSATVPQSASPSGPSDPQLKLFGVAGSPGRWLVTINNQFFLLNEEANVKVPGGAVKLKVVAIGSNYADVVVEGTAVTKHLTIDQKK